MSGRGTSWAKAEEKISELWFCKNCQKEVHFIINMKSMIARCPECTFFAPRESFKFKIVGKSTFNTESE